MKWNRALEKMKPYKPGTSIEEVKRVYGLKEVVKLASNENPYGSAPSATKYLSTAIFQHEVYPDGHAVELRKKLAMKHEIDEASLIFGNGSDEIISIISRALLAKGTNTIMATPTFPQYAHNALIEGAEIREIPLLDGQHDLNSMFQAIDENTTVIWLCTPNNPTGNLIAPNPLQAFLDRISANTLVVLDEAYYEYITAPTHVDSVRWLEKYPNILILRTFSKAYGLASFRIGYGMAHPTIISELNKVRNPFNTNVPAMLIAEKALEDTTFIQQCQQLNHEQRLRYQAYAASRNLHLFDSETNFVLMEVNGDADEASQHLLQCGFIIRSGNALGTPGYIRVTIGTEKQNTGFFDAFDSYLELVGES